MFRRLGHLFEYFFRRRSLEDDLDEELRSSFEMVVDRFVARGIPLAEARRRARLEFEGLEQVKERVRDGLAGSALRAWLEDMRYAWRGLRRRPSFAIISLVTLALGIGVNAAIFSVFYAVLLRPLPYGRPEQLGLILSTLRAAGTARAPVSGTILSEVVRRNRSLAGVAGMWVGTGTFTGENPELVRVAQVTPNFFDVMGVSAARGRTFIKEEEAGGRPAIVLSDGFFRRRFAANASLIGTGLPMREAATTLVGVLPPEFQLHFAPDAHVPADVQAFIPFPYDIYDTPRDLYFLRLVARLKPGVSITQAQRDLDRVAAEIRGAFTEYSAENLHFTLTGMQSDAVRDIRPALTALFAGAAFLLLICCVNVTSLLLARASDRRKEIALRLAIGASRGRIVRQLLAEGGVLCMLGGAAGLAVGWAGFRGLLAIRPERLARIGDAGLNWPVVAFSVAVSLGAAVVFGLAPAIESFRLDLTESLRAGGRGWIGRLHRRAGGALVIGEITIAFVLVTGAALTARTLSKIEQVRPGFEPRHRLTFQIAYGRPLNPAVQLKSISDWEAQLAALPGVERVGATSHLPLDDFPNWYSPYRPKGVTENPTSTRIADHRCVTPGYFAAMGTRLLEGRSFDPQDRAGGRPVLIVDELLARSTWPGQSAIGKIIEAEHVKDWGFAPVPSVVVGVVEHVRNHSLTQQVRGEIYIPFEQSPRSPLSYVLRTRVEPLSLVPAIREMLHRRDPDLAMAKVRPMTEYVAREIAPASFTAVLAAIFSALALVLAAAGIYGVLNYQVSRRLPEMGIRMALGAGARDVFRLVLGEGLRLAAAGALLGAAAALIAAQWLGTLVYGVSPRDPLSYALAVLLLPAVALLGCWRPAWRAAAADPAQTIREE
ncbi:MAG: ABC transporter permease [Acidobacteriia bacterium]|nr:ABC transporter permease [Terriglobia bacterium]